MSTDHSADLLPMADDSDGAAAGCGCGGCGCGTSTETGTITATEETAMTDTETHTYAVNGMTCGHCANAVTSELSALAGVTGVSVDLVAGGTSSVTVSSTRTLTHDEVAAALDEAGDYRLA